MIAALDKALLRQLRTRLHGPAAERAIVAYTRMGEHAALWFAIAGAGALVHRRRRPAYLRAARATGLAYALNTSVKHAIGRRRPAVDALPALTTVVSGLSYPSSHAATSFAAARALRRALPARPLYALATAMALSRPYVGVHYPSDVLAGAALGTAVEALVE